MELSEAYRGLGTAERNVVDALLMQWVVSKDADTRFDALAIIYDHKLHSALPALQDLSSTLKQSASVSAPYELAKVSRVTKALSDG
jgi:hypothetical protein